MLNHLNNKKSMNEIQNEIKEWAKKAVAHYVSLANNGFDYAFYTQSDLRDITSSPDYFLFQINPGSEGSYKDQLANLNWQLDGKDMDAEHFIRGNYCIDREKGEKRTFWELRNKLPNFKRTRSLFSKIEDAENPLDDVSKFILTNATCFSTPKATKVVYQALEQTLPLTLELADIVKPQKIVVLGNELPNYIKKLTTDCQIVETLLPRIKYGYIHGFETLFIDHPSAYTSKDDTKEVIRLWNKMPIKEAVEQAEKALVPEHIKEKMAKEVQQVLSKIDYAPFDCVKIYQKVCTYIGWKYKYAIDILCLEHSFLVSVHDRKASIEKMESLENMGFQYNSEQWEKARYSMLINSSGIEDLMNIIIRVMSIFKEK